MNEITATETVTVGRSDYGMGIQMSLITIADREFVTNGTIVIETCGDCDNGYSGSKRHYAHVYEAVCFRCNGRGVWGKRYDSVEQAEKAMARRDRAAERRAEKAAEKAAAEKAEKDAERATWAAANGALVARLDAVFAETGNAETEMDSYRAAERYGAFIVDMAHTSQWRPLTERQTKAAEAALAQYDAESLAKAEKAANARHFAEVGAKVQITGTVTVAMNVDGYAYGAIDRLLVVEGTGDAAGCTFKILGSGKTLWDAAKGDTVTVTATVKKHAEYDGLPQTVLTRAKVAVTN